MDLARQITVEQTTLWNGIAGLAWVDAQALLDQMFRPFEELLVAAVAANANSVLDVGCGTGGTTLAIARSLGAKGHCTGIDISQPMIAAARAQARREGAAADFIRADAQTYAFEPASFSTIISRFGVMFFDDPVRAFANLHRAARNDAELRFIAWRSADENPFMTVAEHAARPLLPNIPERVPDTPGQFAFADPHRIDRILLESGWAKIDIRSIDVPCHFPARELVRYSTQLGPLGRVLHEADEGLRTQVVATVRAAFDPFVHGDQVRFNAACWMVSAQGVRLRSANARK
ncbi:MAG: class I SAM-dependent methyltransferase [Gammaproteobacteria bacterium]|nr:MAG: class I SAM-dependent methyltransferase [Gammaproteobacteria bacterium]